MWIAYFQMHAVLAFAVIFLETGKDLEENVSNRKAQNKAVAGMSPSPPPLKEI